MPPTPESAHGLLVVTIDRLPAWMTAPWGATWVATPTLNTIAARGVVFDRVLTPALDPWQTVRELFAGMSGIGRATAARGWPMAVVADQPAAVAAAALDATAEVTIVPAVAAASPARDVATSNAGGLFAAAARIAAAGRHRAVWCHAGSLGIAWDAPLDFRERYVDPDDPPPPPGAAVPEMPVTRDTDPDLIAGLRHVFGGQITLLDECLGGLVRAVPADGGWALLVVGLRGMPLGIHDWLGGRPESDHEPLPYGEVVHVPAILVDPAGRMAAQRYGGLVTPADLAVTVADLVTGARPLPSSQASRGRSLVGLFESWSVRPRDRIVIRGRRGDACATPGWHAIVPHEAAGSPPLLFAKPDDFFELSDVANRERAVAEELSRVLQAGGGREPDAAWEEPLSAEAVSAAS